jgi:hypothetical protein
MRASAFCFSAWGAASGSLYTAHPLSQRNAGLLESDDPKDALDGFAGVIQMEKEKGEWCVFVASPSPPPLFLPCCLVTGVGVVVEVALCARP